MVSCSCGCSRKNNSQLNCSQHRHVNSYFIVNLIISVLSCPHLKAIILMGTACLKRMMTVGLLCSLCLFVKTSKHLSLMNHCDTAQVRGHLPQWRRCWFDKNITVLRSVSLNKPQKQQQGLFLECVQQQCVQLSQQSVSVRLEQCWSYLYSVPLLHLSL